MAEEKQTPSDIDDWLDDLDDSDEFSGELDQENIDALLGANGTDTGAEAKTDVSAQEKTTGEDEELGEELDQSSIDFLLGNLNGDEEQEEKAGDSEEKQDLSAAELDQENIDALFGDTDLEEGDGDESPELDQDNIDALLSGTDLEEEPDAEAGPELDQENIDALLSGTDLEEEPDAEAAPELDQENIDALLSGTDLEEEPEAEASPELDQDNIDALLSGEDDGDEEPDLSMDSVDSLLSPAEDAEKGDEKEPAAAEDASELDAFLGGGEEEDIGLEEGLDVDQDEIDQLFSGLDDEEEEEPFGAEEIDFAQVLDGEDEFLELGDDESDEKASVDGDETVASDDDEATVMDRPGEEGDNKAGFPYALLDSVNKTVVAVIAVCLLLLVGVGYYFLTSDGEEKAVLPLPAPEEMAAVDETEVSETPENYVPLASDGSYQMPAGGGEVTVLLSAEDADGDPLTFTVTSPPQHGRLSGEAPALTYLPNKDFPGKDSFEFTASDGKMTSNLGTVLISGPDLLAANQVGEVKQEGEPEKKSYLPSKPLVRARDVTLRTSSTAALAINWAEIWQKANGSPFTAKTFVDMDKSGLSGSLTRVGAGQYLYRPAPFFEGREVLSYRFKRGGLSSDPGRISIQVRLGNPSPQIHIKPLAEKGYRVGETVVVDASPTRDDSRKNLRFNWDQVAGVPVRIMKENSEGSVVSFVMPSTFYVDGSTGPVLKVTAVDETGKTAQKNIKVVTLSKRHSALWRGRHGGVEESPPMDGRLLPWPYED